MKSYLPVYKMSDNSIEKGIVIAHPKDCERKLAKGECKIYYKTISNKPGFHTCECGLNSYVVEGEKSLIFTGFRVRTRFSKSKHKHFKDIGGNNPIIEECFAKSLVDSYKYNIEVFETLENMKDFFQTLKHETSLWSTEIVTLSERLYKQSQGKKKEKALKDTAQKIFHYASMIDTNFRRFDLLNDSLSTSSGDLTKQKIHQRFHSVYMCLETKANEKNIQIKKHGESRAQANINFEIFDLLPFVLLENAIKYSPENEIIDITFNENTHINKLNVKFESIGPIINDDEINLIFNKGYRGKHVLNSNKYRNGNGIGLYIAKKVSDIHGINIKVQSIPIYGASKSRVMFELEIPTV